MSRPHRTTAGRRHVLGTLISAATICPRREDRRPCPPCRAVPPSVTLQRRSGAARRSQAVAVVCLDWSPLARRFYAQASKIGCTAGRVSVVSLFPHPPRSPVSTRVRASSRPSPCWPAASPRVGPGRNPRFVAGSHCRGLWYGRGPRIIARRGQLQRRSCGRLVCTDVELVLRGTVPCTVYLVVCGGTPCVVTVELPCILGQGHGSKTWPKVVLQSSDQTDKAQRIKKNKAPFDRVFRFWILKNISKVVTP